MDSSGFHNRILSPILEGTNTYNIHNTTKYTNRHKSPTFKNDNYFQMPGIKTPMDLTPLTSVNQSVFIKKKN